MNQSLTTDLLLVTQSVFNSGLLISSCTIQQRTGAVNSYGQPDLSDWNDVAGLVGLNCMLSVQSIYRPDMRGTKRLPTEFELEADRHLYLNGYYPQILAQMSAVVDGVRYEIMSGAECDSQKQTTRLALRTWTQ